jgi:uncharacterized protein YggU (UPF0235/DUF167 family)
MSDRRTVTALRLTVEAHTNARQDRLELVDSLLRVWVKARAIDGRANDAIEQTVAQALGLRNRQVRLVSGARSRYKIVEVDLSDIDAVRGRLAESNRT